MLKTYSLHLTKRLQRTLYQPLILATLTSASLIFGTFGLNSKVAAQTLNLNNTEITNYAKAVLGMEPARQQALPIYHMLVLALEVGRATLPG